MCEKLSESPEAPTSSSFGIVRPIRCDSPACSHPAILRFGIDSFCLDHLVAHCHKRLETYQQQTSRHIVLPDQSQISVDRFLEECTSKVTALLMARPQFENIDRARLLDVLLWAAELDGAHIPRPLVAQDSAKSAVA
jgi:hypothetical protein